MANSRHAGEPFGGRLEATTSPLRNHEQRSSPTFSGEFRHSLTEMPEGAPAYKREPNTLRNATRKETWCPFSCHTDTGFSPLPCRLPAHSHVVESRQRAALVTALMRWVRTGIGAALSPNNSREISPTISGDSTSPDRREAIMTMSEYEERFRPPAPSLHQTFSATRGPDRGRRRSQRFWAVAVLVGVMTMAFKVTSHQTIYSKTSNVSQYRSPASDGPQDYGKDCRRLFPDKFKLFL